jgi:calcium permeable stress-gated cation channel
MKKYVHLSFTCHIGLLIYVYRYFLFLFVNVIFIFLLASTYWQLVRDLANSPAKIPERIAEALSKGRAKWVLYMTKVEEHLLIRQLCRHFFLSYVILQGLGIMPLQLLNLGIVVPRIVYLLFITRTPRGEFGRISLVFRLIHWLHQILPN